MAANVTSEPSSTQFSVGQLASCTALDTVDISSADFALNKPSRAVYVGGAGDLMVAMQDQNITQKIPSVPAGAWLPISITKVYKTNTTATLIVVFY